MAHQEDDPNSRQTTTQSTLLLVFPAGKNRHPARVPTVCGFDLNLHNQERQTVMEDSGDFQAIRIQLHVKVQAAQANCCPSFYSFIMSSSRKVHVLTGSYNLCGLKPQPWIQKKKGDMLQHKSFGITVHVTNILRLRHPRLSVYIPLQFLEPQSQMLSLHEFEFWLNLTWLSIIWKSSGG